MTSQASECGRRKSCKEKGVIPGEEVELKMPGGGMYVWVRDRMNGSISRITRAQIRQIIVSLPDGSEVDERMSEDR